MLKKELKNKQKSKALTGMSLLSKLLLSARILFTTRCRLAGPGFSCSSVSDSSTSVAILLMILFDSCTTKESTNPGLKLTHHSKNAKNTGSTYAVTFQSITPLRFHENPLKSSLVLISNGAPRNFNFTRQQDSRTELFNQRRQPTGHFSALVTDSRWRVSATLCFVAVKIVLRKNSWPS